jgi:DHA2 family methylenomycin A resistance protein-like MFS transporter
MRTQHDLDLPGQAAAIGMLGAAAAAIIEGGRVGWSNSWILAGFGGFRHSRRPFPGAGAPQPASDAATFAVFAADVRPDVARRLLVNVAFYGLIFILSLYFQQVNGWSAFATGLAFVPMMAAVLPANLVAARLTKRFGAPATIAGGALISAISCLALLGIARGTGYWAVCAQLVAMGGGLGLLVPPLTSTLLGSVEKARSGIAAGVLNSARQTGSVLGVALFGSLIGQANAFLFGARAALIISALLLIASALIIVFGSRAEK